MSRIPPLGLALAVVVAWSPVPCHGQICPDTHDGLPFSAANASERTSTLSPGDMNCGMKVR